MSKVALGLSGGVDSSVTVHLLQKAGHEVVGVHMLLTPKSSRDHQAADDARAVADHFGIEFHILDAREAFSKEVMQPFAEAYLNSQTPNPCVRCNATIKFGLLWQEAQRLGCDTLATGHYVRVLHDVSGPQLTRAVDPIKDQSYFLWGISKDILPHILCPLGDYHKEETREIAAKCGLLTASKKESQEICFIPDDDYAAFLQDFCPDRLPGAGHFIDSEGQILGAHDGAWRYTIGQRRGLGLALGYPAYVTATDCSANTVCVGKNEDLFHSGLIAHQVNLLSETAASGQGQIKIRSRDRGTPGSWQLDGDRLLVHFDTPVRAITPGQSVVLYDGDHVLGGGIIQQAMHISERNIL